MPERRVDFPCHALAPTASSRRGQDAIFFRHLYVPDAVLTRVCVDTHPPENLFDDVVLLPVKERERLAGELPLRVNEECLEELDGMSRLALIEVEFKPLLDRFVFRQTR